MTSDSITEQAADVALAVLQEEHHRDACHCHRPDGRCVTYPNGSPVEWFHPEDVIRALAERGWTLDPPEPVGPSAENTFDGDVWDITGYQRKIRPEPTYGSIISGGGSYVYFRYVDENWGVVGSDDEYSWDEIIAKHGRRLVVVREGLDKDEEGM